MVLDLNHGEEKIKQYALLQKSRRLVHAHNLFIGGAKASNFW